VAEKTPSKKIRANSHAPAGIRNSCIRGEKSSCKKIRANSHAPAGIRNLCIRGNAIRAFVAKLFAAEQKKTSKLA
jgi:hypothetical protein